MQARVRACACGCCVARAVPVLVTRDGAAAAAAAAGARAQRLLLHLRNYHRRFRHSHPGKNKQHFYVKIVRFISVCCRVNCTALLLQCVTCGCQCEAKSKLATKLF